MSENQESKLYLSPDADLSGLGPVGQMIVLSLQRYGFILDPNICGHASGIIFGGDPIYCTLRTDHKGDHQNLSNGVVQWPRAARTSEGGAA